MIRGYFPPIGLILNLTAFVRDSQLIKPFVPVSRYKLNRTTYIHLCMYVRTQLYDVCCIVQEVERGKRDLCVQLFE